MQYQGWEFAHLLIAHSLICSFRSNQMSDCERFAQITHSLIFGQQTSDSLGNQMSKFPALVLYYDTNVFSSVSSVASSLCPLHVYIYYSTIRYSMYLDPQHWLTGLGIRSFAHRSFAHLLILLKSNKQLRAIHSDCSRQMRDCEQIAQVAQDK